MRDEPKFNLGRICLPTHSRHKMLQEPLDLPFKDLLTHFFVCGATGFGKTVLGKSIVEECALQGIPSIVIDLKGDLSSLAIPATSLMNPGPDQALLKELLGDEFDQHVDGFEQTKQRLPDYESKCKAFEERVVARVLTPRSEVVRPVALASFPSFDKPPSDCDAQELSDYREMLGAFVQSFLGRLYGDNRAGQKRKTEAALLQALLEHSWEHGQSLEGLEGLETLVNWIINPPLKRVGALSVDLHLDEKARLKLARQINTQLVGVERDWHKGEPFDLDVLLAKDEGRTPILIVNVSHLSLFADQAFVVAQVCYAIYRWMRRRGGSSKPRLLLFLDEIGAADGQESFYPSHPYNPPCKGPINILIRQGRAFGVCCLLATQNVIGVDHKGLGNCGTWAVGNLTSDNERKRIQASLAESGCTGRDLVSRLSGLRPAEFLLRMKNNEVEEFRQRWLYSVHHPPFAPYQLPLLAQYLKGRGQSGPTNQSVAEDAREPASSPAPIPEEPENPPEEPSQVDVTLLTSSERAEDGTSSSQTVSRCDSEATRTRLGSSRGWLIVLPTGQQWELEMGQAYTVGRHKDCDIVVPDKAVSRRQVILDVVGPVLQITADAGSKNVPLLDGNEIPGGNSVSLNSDRAILVLGDTELQITRV